MTASLREIVEYFVDYISLYRLRFGEFVSQPPDGGGYPHFPISPYLDATRLELYAGIDGVVVAERDEQPGRDGIEFQGGAFVVDAPDIEQPDTILKDLEHLGLNPKRSYRIVSQKSLGEMVRFSKLGEPKQLLHAENGSTSIFAQLYDLRCSEIIRRLTLGAIGGALRIRHSDWFWRPSILVRMGFATADAQSSALFKYFEFDIHRDTAAWDRRTISVRLESDIRRDFARSLAIPSGGIVAPSFCRPWIEHHWGRLSRIGIAIQEFSRLLRDNLDGRESLFHEFLQTNPILLDIYGDPVSKPRFLYPDGASPFGKAYVEPDFIIRLPGQRYRFVELERPAKGLVTKQGQPRAEVTQATFQVAEWRAFVKNHYHLVKNEFPGIAVNHTAMVVISKRSVSEPDGFRRHIELLSEQFKETEILTYDDVLERALKAYERLTMLAVPESSDPGDRKETRMLYIPLE